MGAKNYFMKGKVSSYFLSPWPAEGRTFSEKNSGPLAGKTQIQIKLEILSDGFLFGGEECGENQSHNRGKLSWEGRLLTHRGRRPHATAPEQLFTHLLI